MILLSSELSEEDGEYEVGFRAALKPEGQVCWREPVLLLERHSSAGRRESSQELIHQHAPFSRTEGYLSND